MANQGGGSAAGDIEEQLSDNVAAAASTNSDHSNTQASPNQENPDDISTGQDGARNSKGILAIPISLLRTLLITIICRFPWIIVKTLFFSLCAILLTLGCFFYILLTGNTGYIFSHGYEEDDNEKKGSRIMVKKAAINVKIHRLTIVMAARTGFLILLWMAINLSVVNLRRVRVLGSLLWKWSLLASLILLTYPFLMYMLNCIIFFLIGPLFTSFVGSDLQYYMEGISEGLLSALYFTSILLAWLLCVDTTNPRLHRYGMLTLVSLLVGGVLSLLKSFVLLWWRTKLIYVKYKEKILSAGFYLFFNLLLVDQDSSPEQLLHWLDRETYTPQNWVPADSESKEMEDHKERPSGHKILHIEDYMLKQDVKMKSVHVVATCLTKNYELSLTEDDDIPDIVPYLRKKFRVGPGPEYGLTKVRSSIDKSSAELLTEQLQLETSKEDPPYEDFEKWMVGGCKYSYAVGNRIDGAFQVMRILSRVMTTFIVAVVVLVWLFLTGFATTKVVVGLASIFLGLSFVFGDASKTFFQGVIFSFVTHPFDVADRCIIDDKELKVKKINILTTTFFGSQPKEIVLYPNSDLATKRIMLLNGEQESESKPEHKAETDQRDFVEFILPPQTTSLQIESLQDTVERHLEGEFKLGVYKNSYYVSFVEFGDSIKIRVYFEHVLLSDGDSSEHSESVETRKQKQRSKLVIRLKKFLDDLGK